MRVAAASILVLVSLSAHAAGFDQLRVSVSGGKSVTNWHGQVDIHAVNFEFARPISPRTEMAIVVTPTSVWQPRSWFGYAYGNGNEKVPAIAGSFLVRRLFDTKSPRLRYYAEVSVGPMWAEKRVPAATSRFNMITQGGFGVLLRQDSRYPVYAGYRFHHISNGGYAPRNPGLNVSSLVLGVQLRR